MISSKHNAGTGVPDAQKALTLRRRAKFCEWCGGTFTPVRSTGRFCCDSHRVAAFNAAARAHTRAFKAEQQSAISMGFDGRVGGRRRVVGRTRRRARGLQGWVTPLPATFFEEARG